MSSDPNPSPASAPRRQASGPARTKAKGRVLVYLTLEPAEKNLLRQAATLDGRPLSQFVLRAALAAAKMATQKNS